MASRKLVAITLLGVAALLASGCARNLKPGWGYPNKAGDESSEAYDFNRMSLSGKDYLEKIRNRAFFGKGFEDLTAGDAQWNSQRIENENKACGTENSNSITRAHVVGMVLREKDGLSEKTRRIGKWGEKYLGPATFLGFAGASAGLIFEVGKDLVAGSALVGASSLGAGQNWVPIGLVNDLHEGRWLFDCIEQTVLQHPACSNSSGKNECDLNVPNYRAEYDDKFSLIEATQIMNAIDRAYGEIRIAVYGTTLDYENFKKRAERIRYMVDDTVRDFTASAADDANRALINSKLSREAAYNDLQDKNNAAKYATDKALNDPTAQETANKAEDNRKKAEAAYESAQASYQKALELSRAADAAVKEKGAVESTSQISRLKQHSRSSVNFRSPDISLAEKLDQCTTGPASTAQDDAIKNKDEAAKIKAAEDQATANPTPVVP
ncbi:MAG: hypothetical protein HQL51_02590 [Magnetococcales bacterium]|nr:hypothetical protein [Magnetococcales bacterium]